MQFEEKKEQNSAHTFSDNDILLANQLLFNAEAHNYDKKYWFQSSKLRNYYLKIFQNYIFTEDFPSQGSCLDVGCGTGYFEELLSANKRLTRVVAIDATMQMLKIAQAKFGQEKIMFLQTDAQHLPFRGAQFDLVCSNAFLHHLLNFDTALVSMVKTIKPGGKIFMGYEPNAISYRLFKPLLLLLSKMVPEQKNIQERERESGQDKFPTLKNADIHRLSEYHIFEGNGIHPYEIKKKLQDLGIVDVKIFFSSLYQFALLRDTGIPFPVDRFPDWVYAIPGRLSLSFSIVGKKSG